MTDAFNIELHRARYATKIILRYKVDEGIENKRLKSYANALPAMIQMNGIGQTLAFCRSKKGKKSENEYFALYELLSGWLCSNGNIFDRCEDALNAITDESTPYDMFAYQQAQAETLALLTWVKKLANAYLSDEKDSNPEKEPPKSLSDDQTTAV